jgi:hypothetical protein
MSEHQIYVIYGSGSFLRENLHADSSVSQRHFLQDLLLVQVKTNKFKIPFYPLQNRSFFEVLPYLRHTSGVHLGTAQFQAGKQHPSTVVLKPIIRKYLHECRKICLATTFDLNVSLALVITTPMRQVLLTVKSLACMIRWHSQDRFLGPAAIPANLHC